MSLMTAQLRVCFIIHGFNFILSVSFRLSELLSLFSYKGFPGSAAKVKSIYYLPTYLPSLTISYLLRVGLPLAIGLSLRQLRQFLFETVWFSHPKVVSDVISMAYSLYVVSFLGTLVTRKR